MRANIWRLTSAAVFAISLAASVVAGTPVAEDLPTIALAWEPLFHVERAAALTGLVALCGLVGWRAGSGQFPTRVGSLEYALDKADSLSKKHESRLIALEESVEQIEQDLSELRTRDI